MTDTADTVRRVRPDADRADSAAASPAGEVAAVRPRKRRGSAGAEGTDAPAASPGHRPARLAAAVICRYVLRRPRDGALLAAWSAIEVIPTFALGRAVAGATDAFLAGSAHLATGFGWLGLLLAAAAVGSVGSRNACIRLAAIVEPFRDDLVRGIVAGAVRRCVENGEPADTSATARISHQAELIRDSFGGMLSALRMFVFVAGSALAGLATLLPMALLLAAGPLLAGLVLFAALVGAFARRQRDYILTEEAVATASTTVLTALRDVTACGGEDQVYAATAGFVDAQVHASRGVARMAAARALVLAVGGWLPIPLLLAAAPWMLRRGATAGQIVGALAYLAGGVQAALHTLVQGVGSSGVRMAVTLERIMERGVPSARAQTAAHCVSSSTGSPADPPVRTADPPVRPVECHLDLRGLTFSYGPQAIPVISDLSLFIPDGDHLAIVGPSGIGKSTLAGLITGMLNPCAGEVRLGSVPLQSLGAAELTSHRVLIPQEAYVFAGTVAENLAYLNRHASSTDLDTAAQLLGLRPLVTRLGGYDGHLEPALLSAGERQLIALGRSYLSPARLAVLDEATCHLDPAAEARAEQAFADRVGTLIVVAHRMSSALRARRILVLDGNRAEVGDHRSLLERSPLYRDLAGYWQTAAGTPATRDARPSSPSSSAEEYPS